MPRRLWRSATDALEMSSVTVTVSHGDALGAKPVLRGVEVEHVAGVVAVGEEHPAAAARRGRDECTCCVEGDAKRLPIAAPCARPWPTSPPNAG